MALVPPRRLELMLLHLRLQQRQQLGAVPAATLLRRRNYKKREEKAPVLGASVD